MIVKLIVVTSYIRVFFNIKISSNSLIHNLMQHRDSIQMIGNPQIIHYSYTALHSICSEYDQLVYCPISYDVLARFFVGH
jgi:hypothetical protein